VRRPHHALGEGKRSQLQTSMKSEFLQSVVDVALDRVQSDVEFVGDFLVAHPPGNKVDNLVFAPGEFDGLHETIGFAAVYGVLDDM